MVSPFNPGRCKELIQTSLELLNLENKEALDKYLNQLDTLSPESEMTIENEVKKIQTIIKDPLVIYIGAKKIGMDEIANYFLQEWQKKFQEKVRKIDASLRLNCNERVCEEKLTKIVEKLSRFYLEYSNELLRGLCPHNLLIKEIFFRLSQTEALTKFPGHVSLFSGLLDQDLSPLQKYLLNKYACLLRKIEIISHQKKCMTNQHVETYLRRFTHLQELNLENCTEITSAPFKQGHRTLEILILNGTRINRSEITQELFPRLEKVLNSKS